MVSRLLHILLAFIVTLPAWGRVDTRTGMLNERIRSLQVKLDGNDDAPPVIVLNTPDRLIFSFDHLGDDRVYLRYELIHCNADWQPSTLVDSEFLDGFNQGSIDDYAFSEVTTVHYVNYRLAIPNEQVAPRISGNYLLRVYPEDDPDDTWLQCRFMVSEQSAGISARLSGVTDVDYNDAHQQLSIEVDTERANVTDPFNDITVMIQQNGRYDSEVALRQPLRMASAKVSVYEHQAPLIFEAGNEYRRFEAASTTYPGMGVEEVAWADPYYHVRLATDLPRADAMYLYAQTRAGRFTIREYNVADSDIEADYVVVHFSLEAPEMPGSLVFLDGDFTCRHFDDSALMSYNRATGRYEHVALLKQGQYNYQYLVVPPGSSRGYTAPIEGDRFQTQNEYLIKVYTRRPGDRADRLIAVSLLGTRASGL